MLDGKISYKHTKIEKKSTTHRLDLTKGNIVDQCLIRSDSSFGNGVLEFKAKLETFETGIIVLLSSFDNKEVRCGYSRTYKQFLITLKDGVGYKILSSAGDISNYNLEEEIKFKIDVNGSQVNLFVNNILLCSTNISIKESQIEFDLGSTENFEIYDIQKNSLKPKIFVVMQFSNEYNELFEEVIKPVTEKFGYECIRADEYYTGTPILSDIINSIKDSTAIIAEITPDNPNVFYEIGYSHAIGKPTILLCDKKREKLPFDLSGFRTLFYENTIAGKKKVETSLMKYLENI
jgi:hypothetical protein